MNKVGFVGFWLSSKISSYFCSLWLLLEVCCKVLFRLFLCIVISPRQVLLPLHHSPPALPWEMSTKQKPGLFGHLIISVY